MQLIGFNITKITAQRSPDFKRGTINNNIEIVGVDKEDLDLIKDKNPIKFSFVFTVTYSGAEKESASLGDILLEGNAILSSTEEEQKDILKSWKKKHIPEEYKIPLINFIIRKCSTKALLLEDELNLPTHLPFPQLKKDNTQSSQAP